MRRQCSTGDVTTGTTHAPESTLPGDARLMMRAGTGKAGAGVLALLTVLLVSAFLAVMPARAHAQTTRADSAAILLDAATRLERNGQSDAAAALYRQIQDRFGGTPAAATAAERLANAPARMAVERGGRVELTVFSTLYGLWLGVAIPAAFGADDPEPFGLGLLAGGPVGLLTGLRYSRSRGLTEGQARAITFGGTWGSWQGLGWAIVSDLGEGFECDGDVCIADDAAEERFLATIGGGLAGIAVGAVLAGKPISAGTASTVNFGALWGTWFGLAAGVIGDLEDDGLLSSALIGGDAGLLTAALLAPRWNVSRNRARLVSIAGVIGGLAGAGIDLIAQPDDDKAAVAIPLATSVAGLIIGSRLTRDYDRRGGEQEDASDGGAALIELADGRLRAGPVLPMPVLQAERKGGGVHWRPALHVPVARLQF